MSDKAYNTYALVRDANTIAKFLSKLASHREKLALYQMDPSRYAFPRPVSKNAKYPAYSAASRIESLLNLGTHANSVPQLAEVYAKAMQHYQDK